MPTGRMPLDWGVRGVGGWHGPTLGCTMVSGAGEWNTVDCGWLQFQMRPHAADPSSFAAALWQSQGGRYGMKSVVCGSVTQ
jgi:hypothetical protein